jgi:hypothetical protein
MKTVVLRVPSRGFGHTMMVMRVWLDENRFQAGAFAYDRDGEEMVGRVGFNVKDQADAFVARFDPAPQANLAAA